MVGTTTPRTRVVVRPATAFDSRPRLFAALERAYPVDFATDGGVPPQPAIVSLEAVSGDSQPRSLNLLNGQPSGRRSMLELADSHLLALPLQGVRLSEEAGVEVAARPPAEGVEVLASVAGQPIWVRRRREDWSVLAPDELPQDEPLRERLRDGIFFGLLPLVHWLREVAPQSWMPPPLRAAFLFDDPNLHWNSYGFVRYTEMLAHARAHDYAATMAIIPRDLWWTHSRAANTFRSSDGRLALAVHGNDHVKGELAQPLSAEGRRALLAQAMRRVASFESKAGVEVARVMVPPHGVTSREMVLDMPAAGFEAMTDSRPYPWLMRAPAENPLAGWETVDVVDGGLPIIPRYHLSRSREDLPLRAFLGQPIILYGHHGDLAPGLDVLADAADDVRALGPVEWMPVGEIARSNYSTRTSGETMEVRLFNPVVDIDVPRDVERIIVDASLLGRPDRLDIKAAGANERHPLTDGLSDALAVGGRRLRLEIVRFAAGGDAVESPGFRVWPLLRRFASEGRDRLMPVARRRHADAREPRNQA